VGRTTAMPRNRFTAAVVLTALLGQVPQAMANELDDRIAARLATIDQKLYETQRRCYGWQQGIYELLTRLKPYIVASDAKTLDDLTAQFAPDQMFGPNETFLAGEMLMVDRKAGDDAWGQGILEWQAQQILPPDQQYAYYGQYGTKFPDGCVEATVKIDDVRTRIEHARDDRNEYGKDYIPPISDRYP
jgi:hypothetical protein